MDGLMVYRQYLENIRSSINNYSLPELESKEFMGIIKRVGQISDLSYIDVILQNAGLTISFIGDKKFLNEKVILKSKLDKYFEDASFVKDRSMKDALSEYMSMFIIEEDSIIDNIEEITGENGIPEVSLDYFPQSSAKYYSAEEILEKNKETLTALFGAVDEMNKKLNPEEQSNEFVEEFFDEDTEDEELKLESSDIRDLISEEAIEQDKNIAIPEVEFTTTLESKDEIISESKKDAKIKLSFDLTKKDNLEDKVGVEEVENDVNETSSIVEEVEEKSSISEDIFIDETQKPIISQNRKMDVSFLSEDEEEEEPILVKLDKENDDYDDYDEEVSKKDFNKFLEEEVEEENISEEPEVVGTSFDYEEEPEDDYNDFIDNTGKVLARELEDEDDKLLKDTDPVERNMFEETANYFLTGKSEVYGKDDLRSLYKSKEKIVDSEDVSSTDDAVAKMVLAMTDGLLNLPRVTGRLFKKAKSSGRKMRENMIVEDEEDDG